MQRTTSVTGTVRTAMICLAVLLEGMSSSSINVQVARIQEAFDVGGATLSLLAGAFLVVYAAFLPVAGRLADAVDARATFVAGLLAFALGSLLCAVAPAAWAVVVGRGVQGLGAALSAPAAMVLITRGREQGARSRAIATYGAMGAVGFSLGLVLPGFVVDAWGWRASFAVLLPLVAVVLWATRGLPASGTAGEAGRVDLRGAVIVVAGLMALMHGLGNVSGGGLLLGVELSVVVVALVLLRARRAAPLPPVVTGSARVRFAAVVLGTVFAAVVASTFVLSLALQHDAGLSPSTVSLLLLPQPAFFSLLASTGTRATARLGTHLTVAAGQLLTLVALLLLAFVTDVVHRPAVVLVTMALMGACLAMTFPSVTTYGLESVPEGARGAASGLITTAQNVGGALGLALVAAWDLVPGPLAPARTGPAMLLCAAVLVVGGLVGAVVLRRGDAPLTRRALVVP